MVNINDILNGAVLEEELNKISIKMQRVLRLKGFTSVGGEFVSNISHLNLD